MRGDPSRPPAGVRDEADRRATRTAPSTCRVPIRAALLGWLALSRIGELAPDADVAATSLAWYRRAAPGAGRGRAACSDGRLDEAAAWAVADLVRVLLALPRPSTIRGRGPADAMLRLIESWLARDAVRAAIGRQHLGGRRVARPRPVREPARLGRPARRDRGRSGSRPGVHGRLAAAAEAAGYRVDELLAALSEPAPTRSSRPRKDRWLPDRAGAALGRPCCTG